MAGIALERTRFGPADQTVALARAERSVRVEIDAVASALSDIASSVAREPALFDTAAADPAGARPLLDRADQALQGRTAGVFAVTAYRPSGAWPLAWSGVPSEIGVERIAGPETFFVARGPLGLRLIYIKPVLDPVTGHRVGVIAAERLVSSSRGIRTVAPEEGILSLPTLVPATVRPHDPQASASGFVVQSPLGQPLLVARVTAEAIEETRACWRGNISAVVLGILALTLVVAMPPLLRMARVVSDAERSPQSNRRDSGAAGRGTPSAVVRADSAVDRSGISHGGAGPRASDAASHADGLPADDGGHRRPRCADIRSRRTAAANHSSSTAAAGKPAGMDDVLGHAAGRRLGSRACCSSDMKCCSATRSRRRRSMRCIFRCTRSSRRVSRLPSGCFWRRQSSSGQAS